MSEEQPEVGRRKALQAASGVAMATVGVAGAGSASASTVSEGDTVEPSGWWVTVYDGCRDTSGEPVRPSRGMVVGNCWFTSRVRVEWDDPNLPDGYVDPSEILPVYWSQALLQPVVRRSRLSLHGKTALLTQIPTVGALFILLVVVEWPTRLVLEYPCGSLFCRTIPTDRSQRRQLWWIYHPVLTATKNRPKNGNRLRRVSHSGTDRSPSPVDRTDDAVEDDSESGCSRLRGPHMSLRRNTQA